MHGRKLEKAEEKIEELREKSSSEMEVVGEAIRELKARLCRLASSNGDGWIDLRMRLKEIADDLREKAGIKH